MATDDVAYGTKGATGFKRIWRAFHYSMSGIESALKHEAAFRQEMLLAIIMIPASFWMPVGLTLRALMIASVLMVLVVELLNSAIEAAIDYISTEHHPLAKQAKDMGSAAVFISLCIVGAVWAIAIWVAMQHHEKAEKLLELLDR
jgi:diacylglycerol kinase (ATP)